MNSQRNPMRILILSMVFACSFLGACSSPTGAAEHRATSEAPPGLLQTRFSDTAGKPVVIADELRAGKNVALVFWQAWCAPCRAEAPALADASRKYSDLEIIGVVSGPDESVDAEQLQQTIAELQIPYPSLRDRTLELTRAFEVTGTPTIVVLGEQGEVLYRGHKVPEWETLLPDAGK